MSKQLSVLSAFLFLALVGSVAADASLGLFGSGSAAGVLGLGIG